MKKFLVLVLMLGMVSVAHASYYWNVIWSIMAAYSPEDLDTDTNPTLLSSYDITWSLVYCGENQTVSVDESTGDLIGATLIDSMSAGAGASGISWSFTNSQQVVTSGTYNQYLRSTGTPTYLGEVNDDTRRMVYQYIYASKGDDAYYWLSDGTLVRPTDTTSDPPKDLGKTVELGPKDNTTGYPTHFWSKVQSVPEPTTMSLLGIGALAMVLRRKLRK